MHGTDGELGLRDALVTLSAGFGEVCGVDGGARVAGTENGVHSVARSAIRRGDFPFFERQAVIAVGVGGQAIGRQVVAQRQAGIAVATAAGLRRNIFGI